MPVVEKALVSHDQLERRSVALRYEAVAKPQVCVQRDLKRVQRDGTRSWTEGSGLKTV
jgi:hypothetical protein